MKLLGAFAVAVAAALGVAVPVLAAVPGEAPETTVCLVDSTGGPLAGAKVTYYLNGWQTLGATGTSGCVGGAIKTGNITFAVSRGGITNEKTQDTARESTVTFKTVPTTVTVRSSTGAGAPGAAVSYYGTSWVDLGQTGADGSVTAELLAGKLYFHATVGGVTNEVVQDTRVDPAVAFQTVKTSVKVIDSSGAPVSGAAASYYGTSWVSMGSTGPDGMASLELLPARLYFHASTGGVTNEIIQDTKLDPVALFRTVKTVVKVVDSTGGPVSGAAASYYGTSWVEMGSTGADGTAAREILPAKLYFHATVKGITNEIIQDTTLNPVVVFQGVKTTVKVVDSTGAGVSGAAASFYGTSWVAMGSTGPDGTVSAELLPAKLYFHATLGGITNEVIQDTKSDATVVFRTVKTAVKVIDSTGAPVSGAAASYYGTSWVSMGSTGPDGMASLELLPAKLYFHASLSGVTNEIIQDTKLDPVALFRTVKTTVSVRDGTGAPIAGAMAQFYGTSWVTMGTTGGDGTVSQEILPAKLYFHATVGKTTREIIQDTGTNPRISFQFGETVTATATSPATTTAIATPATQTPAVDGTAKTPTPAATASPMPATSTPSPATATATPTASAQVSATAATATVVSSPPPAETVATKPALTATAEATKPGEGNGRPSLAKTMVSATDAMVTWRIEPEVDGDYLVWDENATSCREFGGAACGGIGIDGTYGKFYAGQKGQYLLVTQDLRTEGNSCHAQNTARWEVDGVPGAVSATYHCSGASAMGWPLLGVAFLGATGAAWAVRRRLAWPRRS